MPSATLARPEASTDHAGASKAPFAFAKWNPRPILVAIADPTEAGKSTFFRSHVASAGLRFANADVLAAELAVGPYEAARLADALSHPLLGQPRASSPRPFSPIPRAR